MPRTRECDYCGDDIEPGTGTLVVLNDGSTVDYCSSKCEKNADLGREPRDVEWTASGRAASGQTVEEPETEESEPEPEPEAEETEAAPDLEAAEEDAADVDESEETADDAEADEESGDEGDAEAEDVDAEDDEPEEEEAEA